MRKTPTGPQSFGFSHGTSFIVDQSIQTDLPYHIRGRTVRGRVVVAEGKFDWNALRVMGFLDSKPQPATEFSPLGTQGIHIAVTIENNGRFEAEAVPAGSYTLRLHAHKQDRTRQMIQTELLVPEGSEVLDLGEVAMKVMKVAP
jgi:hypothetical protein